MKIESPSNRMRLDRPVALVAALLFAGACTTTTITPEYVTKPTRNYDTVVVGDVKMEGEKWHHLLPHFRSGLIGQLKREQAFKTVLNNASNPGPNPVPQSAILVTGRINSIDEGSAAARFLIGFGAGRAKARGTFAIHDAGNKSLAKFQTWESYSGGAGIGGMDMVQMEEILERLGRETAKTVVRWLPSAGLRTPATGVAVPLHARPSPGWPRISFPGPGEVGDISVARYPRPAPSRPAW